MTKFSTDKLFSIAAALRDAKISHSLALTRDDAITIVAAVPGQRWEIDVFVNGEIEFEVFRSGGTILTDKELTQMIREFAD